MAEVLHGTYSGYNKGRCRCDECAAVNSARSHGEGVHVPTDRLLTMCWCGKDMVLIDRDVLLNGLGGLCGRPKCEGD